MQLINGDCLIEMQKIIDKNITVDAIICDLPYGSTAAKWDSIIPADKLWELYRQLIKPTGVIALFANEPFASLLRTSNLEMYRYDWIWNKGKPSNFQLMNYQCGRVHELILIFSKAKACYTKNGDKIAYYPQMVARDKIRKANVKIYGSNNLLNSYNTDDNFKEYTQKHPISILDFKKDTDKFHPTQKPVALCEYLIKTYTREGELVLDNTMGSGSTGVACKNTGRDFIGIELDKEYFDIAKRRLKK